MSRTKPSSTWRWAAPDAIRKAHSAHVNLVHDVNRLFNFGGELMWGKRENNDGADGDALRLQFSLKHKFN